MHRIRKAIAHKVSVRRVGVFRDPWVTSWEWLNLALKQESEAPAEKSAVKPEEKTSSPAAPMEEDSEADSSKAEAQKEKEKGNAAYRTRKFEEAIKHYDAAISLDGSDISFLTNRSARRLAHAFDYHMILQAIPNNQILHINLYAGI